LEHSRESFSKLSGQEKVNLEQEAIEEVRNDLGLTGPGERLPDWARMDRLRQTHAGEIEAKMRDLHGPDMGQFQRNLERLMPGINESAVTITINENEDRQMQASRRQTQMVAVTPGDVSTDRMLDRLADNGIRADPAQIELTARQVTMTVPSTRPAGS
jgi:hypothetical protein